MDVNIAKGLDTDGKMRSIARQVYLYTSTDEIVASKLQYPQAFISLIQQCKISPFPTPFSNVIWNILHGVYQIDLQVNSCIRKASQLSITSVCFLRCQWFPLHPSFFFGCYESPLLDQFFIVYFPSYISASVNHRVSRSLSTSGIDPSIRHPSIVFFVFGILSSRIGRSCHSRTIYKTHIA